MSSTVVYGAAGRESQSFEYKHKQRHNTYRVSHKNIHGTKTSWKIWLTRLLVYNWINEALWCFYCLFIRTENADKFDLPQNLCFKNVSNWGNLLTQSNTQAIFILTLAGVIRNRASHKYWDFQYHANKCADGISHTWKNFTFYCSIKGWFTRSHLRKICFTFFMWSQNVIV